MSGGRSDWVRREKNSRKRSGARRTKARAVLCCDFDCDGLLADTETPDFTAWETLYAEQGLPFPVAEWAQTVGLAKGQDAVDRHAPLALAVGPSYDRSAAQARRHALYQQALDILAPMPGIRALLDAFADDGIPCAVASNSSRDWVDSVLRRTEIADRFAAVATADEVNNPKPAPDVYLLAAEKLGVSPSACITFEDSPRGLAAAHAAGMMTVAVPTRLTRHLDWVQAHRLVHSLENLTPADLAGLMEGNA